MGEALVARLAIALALLAALLTPATAAAQSADPRDDVRALLDSTEPAAAEPMAGVIARRAVASAVRTATVAAAAAADAVSAARPAPEPAAEPDAAPGTRSGIPDPLRELLVPTRDGSGDASDRSASRGFAFDISLQRDELDTTFFARQPFGFDLLTAEHLRDDLAAASAHLASTLSHLHEAPASRTIARLAPWVVLLLVVGIGAWQDRRLRRWAERRARDLAPISQSEQPALTELRRLVVRAAAALALPLLLWLASYVPIQGLFESAPWTQALSDSLLLFVFYRLLSTAVREVFSGAWFPVPEDVGGRIVRVFVSSLRLILVFFTLTIFVERIGYRDDVVALSRTLLRLSVTLLSFRLYGLREPVLSLFPDEGSERYLRMVRLLERYSRYVLAFSTFLLALWFLGFRRAASTILLRSWGIMGLSVAAALFLRWFDRRVEALPENDDSLFAAIVAQVDSFARFCAMTAFALAIMKFLGLYDLAFALLDAIRITIGVTPITLLNILRGVVIIAVAVLLSRVIRVLLDHSLYPWLDVDSGAAYALSTSVHYFVLAMATGLALVAIGLDLGALTVFAGALGVGIGFGLQDMARNLMSGFVLLFGRSVRKDDLVTVSDQYDGYVRKIGARAVTIVTRDNYELVVPASDLVNSTIINWTHNDPDIRLRVPVGVSYREDPSIIRDALLDAAERFARRYPRMMGRGRHPDGRLRRADVFFVGFGDSSIDFELLVWIDGSVATPDEARGRVYFDIWDALAERDIEIPFPQRDLHVRSIDADARLTLRRAARSDDAPPESDDASPSPAQDDEV